MGMYDYLMKKMRIEVINLPERTGWTLLRRMEIANNGDRLPTSMATARLVVYIYARFPPMNRKSKKNTNPIANDIERIILIENFAVFELPLPSSFATLTLQF